MSQFLYHCEHLMTFRWNLNLKSKAKRINSTGFGELGYGRVHLYVVNLLNVFFVYYWLPCRYLIESPLIISMVLYHHTPGILNIGRDVFKVNKGINH